MKFVLHFLLLFPLFIAAYEYDLSLGDAGSIRYTYDEKHLARIDRLAPSGDVLYFHSYNYDENDQLIAEDLIGELGKLVYEKNATVRSPYHL